MAVVAGLVGASTFAYFNDTETSSGNTFSAGRLDLEFDYDSVWVNGPDTLVINLSDMKPCDDSEVTLSFHNTGSIPGTLSVTPENIVDDGNGHSPTVSCGILGWYQLPIDRYDPMRYIDWWRARVGNTSHKLSEGGIGGAPARALFPCLGQILILSLAPRADGSKRSLTRQDRGGRLVLRPPCFGQRRIFS